MTSCKLKIKGLKIFKSIYSLISQIAEIARTNHPILQYFQGFLKYYPLGLLAFELSMFIKKWLC